MLDMKCVQRFLVVLNSVSSKIHDLKISSSSIVLLLTDLDLKGA